MLLRIGQKPPATDLVGSLRECHGRIRSFLDLASALVERQNAERAQLVDAAQRVQRYFAEAFPLHVADEEETLLPLLGGRDPEVDRALSQMRDDHGDHAADVARLVAVTEAIAAAPETLEARRDELGGIVSQLRDDLLPHLDLEESVIFPALESLLTDAERDAARDAIRARRVAARATG